jgi:hypothetical protein
MDDAGDNATVIDPARTWLVLWKMRLDRRPLRIAQPEQPAHHCLQTRR